MKKLLTTLFTAAATVAMLPAQDGAKVTIHADKGEHRISRHIYGHFAEHLGHGIYGGIWVGEDSPIPNIGGARKDIIEALRHINIPNLRWPGGCFADEYHWMDGIGPRSQRPVMVNTHWGGVTEDNSFGTHEFLDLCEVLGTEPYICGNVGSGSVEEMSKWVEYISFGGESPMANLRRKNGREEPWKLKYWGVGNENWGCGGNMTAEYYAGEYRRYQTYARNYGDNILYKIVGGPNSDDTHWMEVMMRDIPTNQKQGVSVHHYTITDNWTTKGSATDFTDGEYYRTMVKTSYMDELLAKHSEVMDRYDPEAKVSIVVDEWGAWYDPYPGSNPGFLYQQNTLRDALMAAVNFNIFHKHCKRVHMANIAQLVNVLQALFLTEDEMMITTPTYHAFDMYKVHHDATMLPLDIDTGSVTDDRGESTARVSASASIDDNGTVHISLVNIDLGKDAVVECSLAGLGKLNKGEGKIITSENIGDYNSFEEPNKVVIYDFDNFTVTGGNVKIMVPAKSVVTVAVRQ